MKEAARLEEMEMEEEMDKSHRKVEKTRSVAERAREKSRSPRKGA